MRKRISSRPQWSVHLFALISLTFMYFLFDQLVREFKINNIETEILIGCTLSSIFFYYLTRKRKNIDFDNENLYIISETDEKKIPLNQVTLLKPTLLDIKNPSWILKYNFGSQQQEVRVVPSKREEANFNKFKKRTQEHNPDFSIQDKAHSFL